MENIIVICGTNKYKIFHGGAAVAQLTVNQLVAGSNPARGAIFQNNSLKVLMSKIPLKVVPENIIEDCAKVMIEETGDANNSYSTLLVAAKEYKLANMTPLFLLNPANMDVMVVAEETFGKRLN